MININQEFPITVNGKEYNTVEEIKAEIKDLEALGEQRGAAEDQLLDQLRGLDLRALEHEQRENKPATEDTTTTRRSNGSKRK